MEIPDLLRVARELLFGHDQLFGVRASSPGPGDTAKVVICTITTGEWLVSLDPQEEHLHVEFVTGCEKPHAEVWGAFSWRDSNVRRNRFRENYEAERLERHKFNTRRAELIADMKRQFPFSEAELDAFAKTMLKNLHSGNYQGVMQVINVAEKLVKYEQEDKEEKERKSRKS